LKLPIGGRCTDAQVQAKAAIAAALIQTRCIDPEGSWVSQPDISNHKLAHLRELTERVYADLITEAE
jgi:hypothetical protein